MSYEHIKMPEAESKAEVAYHVWRPPRRRYGRAKIFKGKDKRGDEMPTRPAIRRNGWRGIQEAMAALEADARGWQRG